MSPRRFPRPPLWLQGLLVAALAMAGVGLLFQRLDWADWGNPHWLEGDPVEVYARVKIAAEQPAHALLHFNRIDRLGAPVAADWSAYPVPDRLVFVFTGWLAGLVGLIAAVNLVGAAILGLNATAFYLCARWLRVRAEWAAALALVFALGNYGIRWGITLSLSQVFVLPPLVLLFARAARAAPVRDGARRWHLLAGGLGLWLGFANPYLAYFAGLVGGGALLLSLLRRGPAARRAPLLVFLGVLIAAFLAANAAYLAPRLSGAIDTALVRGRGDFTTYALHPLEWLVPPADHRVSALGALGRAWLAARHGAGEFFYNYLGLLGLAGLALLLLRSGRAVALRRWSRLDAALGLAWLLVLATPLGLNRWLGEAGLDVFRAGTRLGIYAAVWVLLPLAGWLSRRTLRLSRGGSVTLAVLIGLAAVWEQSPPLGDRAVGQANTARWSACAEFTAGLEAALPAGAMVFQLPAVPFPEAGRVERLPDYEHALPFLTSHSLRFSYGPLRGSGVQAWAAYLVRQPAAEMVAALERAGFSLLWIDERGFADGAAPLRAELARLGREEIGAGRLPSVHVFRLRPAATTVLPDFDDPRLKPRWDARRTDATPLLLALRGWFPSEYSPGTHWRWAGRDAATGVWWDGPATRATLRFRVGGPGNNRVELRHDGLPLQTISAGADGAEVSLTLHPGLNTLEWHLRGQTFRPGPQDPRTLGFMVENLSVSVP